MTLKAEKEYQHLGDNAGCADHDHDLVHELSKKLDAPRKGMRSLGILVWLALSSLCGAATITFDPLVGDNGDLYSGHTEVGFTVSPIRQAPSTALHAKRSTNGSDRLADRSGCSPDMPVPFQVG